MAQWQGQFSGFTHETKVQDLENSLRQAVRSAAQTRDDLNKRKAIWHLGERLLAARLRTLRARESALRRPIVERDAAVQKLRTRRSELEQGGVKGILSEFGWRDGPVK